ncbi:hypothetical protein L1887_26567 [Cichorium endivia]|nr:hypothetical protein L1887_26567 [Cichorium endivia]
MSEIPTRHPAQIQINAIAINSSYIADSIEDMDDASNIDLQDYHRINPVPSSKQSIRPGPIQHGTPLMPYIPKDPTTPPPGPDHGNHVDVFP